MPRIGFFYLPWPGHLNPLAGLGQELTRRGHEVAFFQLPDGEADARARGLQFVPFGQSLQPGVGERFYAMGGLEGLAAAVAGLDLIAALADATLRWAEPALRQWRPDLLVVDQMDYAASTLAQVLGIPFVTAAVTLLKQDEEGVPGFDGRPYQAALAPPRPPTLLAFLDRLGALRSSHGLGPFRYQTLWSTLAQVSQQPPEFEYPRRELPPWFHFTGPFAARPQSVSGGQSTHPAAEFPWHRLDGRPLIYASLGTLLNRRTPLLETIVEASVGLGAQLVLSSGVLLPDLPEHVIAVPFAPQLEILRKADLMVTHAGMNSALECLTAGVPMVALPLAHDQPGVAARIEMTGTGIRLGPDERDSRRLRVALRTVLEQSSYREAAREMRHRIAQGEGLARAARVVEEVAVTGRPVLYRTGA